MQNDIAIVTIHAKGIDLLIQLEIHTNERSALRICHAAMQEAEVLLSDHSTPLFEFVHKEPVTA